MSRRKHLAVRKPSGRLRHDPHSQLLSPTEARRMFDDAAAGLCDPVWGTILGRLYRDGKITSSQFAAGKRWCELAADYSVAPLAIAAADTGLDAIGGTDRSGHRQRPRELRATSAPARTILPAAMRCVSSVSRPSVW